MLHASVRGALRSLLCVPCVGGASCPRIRAWQQSHLNLGVRFLLRGSYSSHPDLTPSVHLPISSSSLSEAKAHSQSQAGLELTVPEWSQAGASLPASRGYFSVKGYLIF